MTPDQRGDANPVLERPQIQFVSSSACTLGDFRIHVECEAARRPSARFRATIAPLAALDFGVVDQGKEAIAPLPFPRRIARLVLFGRGGSLT